MCAGEIPRASKRTSQRHFYFFLHVPVHRSPPHLRAPNVRLPREHVRRDVIIRNIVLRNSDFRNVFSHPAGRTCNRSDSFHCGVLINVYDSITIRYWWQQINGEKRNEGNRWYDRIYEIRNVYKRMRPPVKEIKTENVTCIQLQLTQTTPVAVGVVRPWAVIRSLYFVTHNVAYVRYDIKTSVLPTSV